MDLPPDEAETFIQRCEKHDLVFVPLVAPTSTLDRMELISSLLADRATGYVYCVSVTGVTGAGKGSGRQALPSDLTDFLSRVRTKFGKTPLAVGFGLSTREHVQSVAAIAEGAVMGSMVIKTVAKGENSAERVKLVREFVREVGHNVKKE